METNRNPVEELAEEFLARYRRGERPALTEYVQRRPDLASEIRDLFPALVMMEEIGAPAFSEPNGEKESERPIPARLGGYRILREVGRGGMGVVYEAEQESLGRLVALKVLPKQVPADAVRLQRFRREARSAARLHHTNIVPVYEVGEADGINFYAMQCIRGQGLDEVLAELKRLRTPHIQNVAEGNREASRVMTAHLAQEMLSGVARTATPYDAQPTASESHESSPNTTSVILEGRTDFSTSGDAYYFSSVAQLALQVADALVYAHAQKVLHRDIKPANLLLDLFGTIWVTDFGLAKEQGDSVTQTGDIVGTLRYMAPERFEGHSDPRSDVYSLGLTVYEMLALRPAFVETDPRSLIHAIHHDEPPALRRLAPLAPRDLETIVLKAIAKESRHRYQSAAALADDLRRFLADMPIRARRFSPLEQAWRWCRRNRLLAGLSAAVLMLALIVSIGAPMAALLRGERDRAVSAEDQAKQLLLRAQRAEGQTQFRTHLAQAAAYRFSGQIGQRCKALAELRQARHLTHSLELGADAVAEVRNEAIACLCLPDIEEVAAWDGWPTDAAGFAIDPTFDRYATGDARGAITIRRIKDKQPIFAPLRGDGPVSIYRGLTFSPDGRFLHHITDKGRSRLWRLDGEQPIAFLEDEHTTLAFSPDAKQYAAHYPDGTVRFFDAATGRQLRSVSVIMRGAPELFWNPKLPILLISAHPESVLLDLETGQQRPVAPDIPVDGASFAAWHPEGRILAIAGADRKIYFWDAIERRQALPPLQGHQYIGIVMAFNNAGDRLLSSDWSSCWRLWDVKSGELLLTMPARNAQFFFSPDDRLVGAELNAGQIRLFRLHGGQEFRTLNPVDTAGQKSTFSGAGVSSWDRAGRLLTVPAWNETIALVDMERMELAASLPGAGSLAFDKDDALLTSGAVGLFRWPRLDASGGRSRFGPPEQFHAGTNHDLHGISRDFNLIAIPQFNHAIAFRRDTGAAMRLLPQEDVRFCAVSPDGQWVATGSHWRSGAKVWEAKTGRHVVNLPAGEMCSVAFSPAGKWLMTTGGGPRLWSVGAWTEGPDLHSDIHNPHAAFSEDGNLLAVCASAGVVRLVDPDTGAEIVRLTAPKKTRLVPRCFTRDKSKLITVGIETGALHVFDLCAIRAQLVELGLDWNAAPLPPAAPRGALPLPLKIEVDRADFGMTQPARRAHWQKAVGINSLRLAVQPWDFQAALARGNAHSRLGNRSAAVDDFRLAHFLAPPVARGLFAGAPAQELNDWAWQWACAGNTTHKLKAIDAAQSAVAMAPTNWTFRNTLGVVFYRVGAYENARISLERSLHDSGGAAAGFDLFVLAMSHHQLGDRVKAKDCYHEGVQWTERRRLEKSLPAAWAEELAVFQVEAAELLHLK